MITKGEQDIKIFFRPINPDIKPPMGEKIMAKNRSIEANHDAWVSLNFSSGRAIVAYPNTMPKDALTELTTIALIICEMIGFRRSKPCK